MITGNAKLGSRDGIGVATVVKCGINVVAEKIGREARLAGGGGGGGGGGYNAHCT